MDMESEFFIKHLVLQWQRLIDKTNSFDVLTESEILVYINNRDIILGYSVTFNFDINDYVVSEVTDHRLKSVDAEKLDLLEGHYIAKFLPEHEKLADLTKYSANQKFYLLEKLGFLELPLFRKNINNDTKHKVLSKILGCHKRTAKGLLNGEHKYTVDRENAEIVDKFIKDNKLI